MLDQDIAILMSKIDLTTAYSPMLIYSSNDNDWNVQISYDCLDINQALSPASSLWACVYNLLAAFCHKLA